MNNDELLARVASMTPQQLAKELYIDPVSGIQNRNAFNLAYTDGPIAIIDADSLKWVNDNMGHVAGDRLLRKLGQALKEQFGGDAYHLSGDEFAVVLEDRHGADLLLGWLQTKMQTEWLSWPVSGGHFMDLQGAGAFSYGIGHSLTKADSTMQEDKLCREIDGIRAGRGEAPPGLELRRTAKLAELL